MVRLACSWYQLLVPIGTDQLRVMGLRSQHRHCTSSLHRSCFRHNLATDEWVVFSAARSVRPKQVSSAPPSQRISELEEHVASCPFCKGNELLTPPAKLTYPYTAELSDWRLRVVPNKYPAVSPSLGADENAEMPMESDKYHAAGTGEQVDAVGFHEVIIEGPEHNVPTALASEMQVERLVYAFRERGRGMIAEDASLRHVMYFKNSGPTAGASLLHPHSQVLGLPIVPNEVARRQRHAREWFFRFQQNVFQHTLEATLRERDAGGKHRVLLENDDFVCFLPFAALSPFTLWIVPKATEACHFHMTSDEHLTVFASTLRQALRCLHFGLEEPDFNLVIRSAALERGTKAIYRSEGFFRWYALIIPRLGVGGMGGFEFSTGIQSNSSFPEDDAAYLRALGPL